LWFVAACNDDSGSDADNDDDDDDDCLKVEKNKYVILIWLCGLDENLWRKGGAGVNISKSSPPPLFCRHVKSDPNVVASGDSMKTRTHTCINMES